MCYLLLGDKQRQASTCLAGSVWSQCGKGSCLQVLIPTIGSPSVNLFCCKLSLSFISGLLACNSLQAFAGALETLVPLASPLGTLTSPFNIFWRTVTKLKEKDPAWYRLTYLTVGDEGFNQKVLEETFGLANLRGNRGRGRLDVWDILHEGKALPPHCGVTSPQVRTTGSQMNLRSSQEILSLHEYF